MSSSAGERGSGDGGIRSSGGAQQQPSTQHQHQQQQQPKQKKESIVDLSKYIEKVVRVKFQGGREVSGTLKGYDGLLNIVLDNGIEYLRDADDPSKLTDETRTLGLVVCRGTAVIVICPQDGMESIPNPFLPQHDS